MPLEFVQMFFEIYIFGAISSDTYGLAVWDAFLQLNGWHDIDGYLQVYSKDQ